uniref:Uncharacterized protein n=1 Tax=Sinocyclocheilus anshuiensis TaxID=1608454 RepID=A0A671K3J0_9TELE
MSDADSERMDSLDGWVAVKRDAFDDSESHKLRFIVEWNEIETKFAVTCHNRTLQRRGDASGSCAGLFSGAQLSGVGAHLSGVRDELGPLFPDLTRFCEPSLWELLFSSAPRCDADAACRQLERYFGAAVDACGRKIVLDALFSVTEADEREYFENLQEFKCKAMRDEMTRAKDTLGAQLQTHPCTDGLQRLMKIYEEEDETYRELVSVATKFYQNLLQPFRDMREIATLYKTEILVYAHISRQSHTNKKHFPCTSGPNLTCQSFKQQEKLTDVMMKDNVGSADKHDVKKQQKLMDVCLCVCSEMSAVRGAGAEACE